MLYSKAGIAAHEIKEILKIDFFKIECLNTQCEILDCGVWGVWTVMTTPLSTVFECSKL